jgi:hypothetical protein
MQSEGALFNLYCLTENTQRSNKSTIVLERNYIPLKECIHDMSVNGNLVNHTITLNYKNESEKSIEAIFTFPLFFRVCIHSFEAKTDDGKIIKCRLEEKAIGQRKYNNALSLGKTTVLMDKDGDDLFTCKIGNLSPNSCIVVTIVACYELMQGSSSNIFELLVPVTITPRYFPTDQYASNEGNNILGANFSKNPSYSPKPYEMTIKGTIQMNCGEIKVTTKSDANVEFSDLQKNSLSFKITELRSGKDIILVITKDSNYSYLLSEKSTDSSVPQFNYTHLLNLVPAAKSTIPISPNDLSYAIICDRSGSMGDNGGGRMKQMLKAVQLIPQILPDGCVVHAYMFNTEFIKFNNKELNNNNNNNNNIDSSLLTDDFKVNFNNWIQTIKAMGGTQFVPVLQQGITDLNNSGKITKNIIFLTDGDVGNRDQVYKVVNLAKNLGIRIFVMGIGDACSKELLDKISCATQGSTDYVTDNEDLRVKLISMINKTTTASQQTKINVATEGSYQIINSEKTSYLYEDTNNVFYLTSTDPIEYICINDSDQKITPEYVNSGLIKIVGKKIIDGTKDKETMVNISLNTGVLCEHTCFVGVEEIDEIDYNNKNSNLTPKKVLVPLMPLNEFGIASPYFDDNVCNNNKSMSLCCERLSNSVDFTENLAYSPRSRSMLKSQNFTSKGFNVLAEKSHSANSAKKQESPDRIEPSKVSLMLKNVPLADEVDPDSTSPREITPMNMRSPGSPRISSLRGPLETLKEKIRSIIPGNWGIGSNKNSNNNQKITDNKTTESNFKDLIKYTLEKLNEFKMLGDCYIACSVGELSPDLSVQILPGDYIEVRTGEHKGIYKVICAGSAFNKWIIEKVQ